MNVQLGEIGVGTVSPPMVVALAVVAVAYARRSAAVTRQGRALPRWRRICFYSAIAVLVLEPLSPLGESSDTSFLSHMLEHLLIGDVAALLMVLGITGPLIAPLLKLDLISRLRVLANPAVALPVWLVNLYLWHVPLMMDAALGSDYLHVLQHTMFFAAGFNMWMPLFGPLPRPAWFGNVAMLGYIIVVRLAGVLLGNVLIFLGSVAYKPYEGAHNIWGLEPLADQSTAGAVMMVEGTLVSFALFGWLFVKAAREGEQSQRLVDLAAEHGVELSSERSARAAAAGATERLRERIVGGARNGDDGPPPDASA